MAGPLLRRPQNSIERRDDPTIGRKDVASHPLKLTHLLKLTTLKLTELTFVSVSHNGLGWGDGRTECRGSGEKPSGLNLGNGVRSTVLKMVSPASPRSGYGDKLREHRVDGITDLKGP